MFFLLPSWLVGGMAGLTDWQSVSQYVFVKNFKFAFLNMVTFKIYRKKMSIKHDPMRNWAHTWAQEPKVIKTEGCFPIGLESFWQQQLWPSGGLWIKYQFKALPLWLHFSNSEAMTMFYTMLEISNFCLFLLPFRLSFVVVVVNMRVWIVCTAVENI